MILSYVCIIFCSMFVMSSASCKTLKQLGLNSLTAMILIFVAAVITLFPSVSLQIVGLDYLSLMLTAVGIYSIFRSGARRLVPIFGGIIGLAVMSILYQYATRQLVFGAWGYLAYIIIIGLTIFIVSSGAESYIVGTLGIVVSQLIIFALPQLGITISLYYIGGVALASILLAGITNALVSFVKSRIDKQLRV